MSNKNTYNNQHNKIIKNISKLQQLHDDEISTLQMNQENLISKILQNISNDFDIPLKKLSKYQITDLVDDKSVNDKSVNDNNEEIDKPELSVLVKIKIKGKTYYVDKKKLIVYKIMKNKKVDQVGIIDSDGNYILN